MRARTAPLATLAVLTGMAGCNTAQAQEPEQPKYLYETGFKCDMALEKRADAIVQQVRGPVFKEAVDTGSLSSWGWLAHHTGGEWSRAEYLGASSIAALLEAKKEIGTRLDGKNERLEKELAGICHSREDYIWGHVAGAGTAAAPGDATFSTYYVCDVLREAQADEIIKQVLVPVLEKQLQAGRLKSWSWNMHLVGGQYRRLATFTASDIATVLKAHDDALEQAYANPLNSALEGICPVHADYIWEVTAGKFGVP